MLTKITIKNFKRFETVEVELGNPVVLIGPNNSGKTTALQALALWEMGLKRWSEKRKGKKTPEQRPGVTINRRDLVSIPISSANLLWRNLRVRDVKKLNGKQETKNIRVDIIVEGTTKNVNWECGLEFDYANEESFFCRPLRKSEKAPIERFPIPEIASNIKVAFLPPMSGLTSNETKLDKGAIDVRIGEGRTAEVLRNLCYIIYDEQNDSWGKLVDQAMSLFGVTLDTPSYIPERGEITMGYIEKSAHLDISSAGRGLQQTLLLLSYMYANRETVLLLDEPDAHLEILRQKEIYQLLTDVAKETGSQIIAASHSEVLLNEAAGRDVVVAFVGKPHRINDQGSQVKKSLNEIGWDQYYQGEQNGWVVYLEGSTDLAILRAFAKKLNHKNALSALQRPFVKYVGNNPGAVKSHFYGLREALPHLKGIAIFDRLEESPSAEPPLHILMWTRKEIENYLCQRETLEEFAKQSGMESSAGPLYDEYEVSRRLKAMKESIEKVESALKTLKKGSPWDPESDVKVSDDFLVPVFEEFYKKMELYNDMAKKNFHELALFVPNDLIDQEIALKLDAIYNVFANLQN